MWCVPELNEHYIANMEDVPGVYEKPYDPKEPVVCQDEKPITLHTDVRPAEAATPGREARRDSEYERRGTQSRQALLLSHARPYWVSVRPSCSETRHVVSGGHQNPFGIGQPQHPLPEGSDRRLRFPDGIGGLGKIRHPSHSEAWKSAQSGRNRNRYLCQAVSGQERIPDLRKLRQESKAWCRRINKAATKINWRFDRTTARRAFGY